MKRSRPASSWVSATCNVPSVRSATERPDAASSSAANAGQSNWLRRHRPNSVCSPGSASSPAASMPAAAELAPCPTMPRSNTATAQPACASRQPIARPITPPPMTAMRPPVTPVRPG